jgi:hypothetical protein
MEFNSVCDMTSALCVQMQNRVGKAPWLTYKPFSVVR